MGNKIGKLAGREATEGTVQSYIHANGKVGVLVEVDCNTDFVAKNDDFIDVRQGGRAAHRRVADRAVHLRGRGDRGRRARPRCASSSSRPPTSRRTSARRSSRAACKKWLEEVVLLNQTHVNEDKHESRTIEQMRADLSAKTGENVVIRRFARFAVGE